MKSKLEKSIEYIKGYCNKQVTCEKCILKSSGTGFCKLEDKFPCDWDIEKAGVSNEG